MTRIATLEALADPIRLGILDALADGDRTPSDLAHRTGTSSNLLAHHLRTLESAGIIARQRSEADGRRSYFTLATADPIVMATLASAPQRTQAGTRILFVCTQNSARSQFAASLMAECCPLPVTSAGTEPAAQIHPRAFTTLNAHHLAPLSATPQQLDATRAPQDIVITVCDRAYESLDPADVDHHWSVPDPARHDDDAHFEAAFADLTHRVGRLAAHLTEST